MSSRLKPSAVCVRSLVPKEKKSASSAISSARRQARGSSIIVPTEVVAAALDPDPLADRDDLLAQDLELTAVIDQRHHDLGAHLDPRSRVAFRAAKIASTCIS